MLNKLHGQPDSYDRKFVSSRTSLGMNSAY
jgi:hypothetical protein